MKIEVYAHVREYACSYVMCSNETASRRATSSPEMCLYA